jgi:hypothetical protein
MIAAPNEEYEKPEWSHALWRVISTTAEGRSSLHGNSGAQQKLEAARLFSCCQLRGFSHRHVSVADRRSAPFRNVSILWLGAFFRSDLLHNAQDTGGFPESGQDQFRPVETGHF